MDSASTVPDVIEAEASSSVEQKIRACSARAEQAELQLAD